MLTRHNYQRKRKNKTNDVKRRKIYDVDTVMSTKQKGSNEK